MPVSLNSNIISQAVGPDVPLNDLASVYNQAALYRQHTQTADATEEALRQKAVLNAGYQKATRPDGTIDDNILRAHLAQNMGGAQIPVIQKANSDLLKSNAETAEKVSQTGKNVQEVLYNGLKQVDNTIASLAARPDANDQMVYGEMGRLVNAGAFDVQAKHMGVTPDAYAKDLLSTMPVGNPQALRPWLIQQGAKVADATKRLEMSLPKYDEQARGGTINEGTIDQMTGQRTAGVGAGKNVVMTPTADAVLGAQTQRRGQDIVDARTKQYNDITQEAGNSQVVETPQGFVVVNKGTANARPVADANGQPMLTKDSTTAKNAQMADRLTGMIPLAKTLLQGGATASGAGALIDKAMAFTGNSTKGSDAATALETVSGWMTSNVPRFEGPQSDKDTATYRTMAGLIGDRTQPVSTRLKALETVETLMQQYSGHRTLPYSGPPGTQPATTVAPRPATPPGYQPAAHRTGPGWEVTPPAAPAAPAGGGGGRPSIDTFFQH